MGLIPRSEYPFIRAGVLNFGPFDSSDFVTGDGLSSISIESLSSESSITAVSHSHTTNFTSSISSEVSLLTYNSLWCPDRDMWVDEVWMRAKTLSTDNMNRLRLLSVGDGQSIKKAWANRQFITSRAYGNIGDETLSSYDSVGSGETNSFGDPMVINTKKDLRVIPNQNKVPAGGLLVILAEEVPDALVDLIIGVRFRETPQ